MAELAFGAVRSLLGLLRDEAQRLVRVGDDVQFIREEMESMNSFLLHLARTAPPSGEHDEPVRMWMKQVRDLAFDCSNCVDLYVRRGGAPAAVVASTGGLRGYLWSVQWSVRALFAQHQAAVRIRELKVRARDVGERRQRYGVELPKITDEKAKEAAGPGSGTVASSSSTQPAGGGGGGDESGRTTLFTEDAGAVVSNDFIRGALGFVEPDILEECTQDLIRWLKEAAPAEEHLPPLDKVIAISAPDKEDGRDIAQKAYDDATMRTLFERKVWLPRLDYIIWSYFLNRKKYMEKYIYEEENKKREAAKQGAAKPEEDAAASAKPAEQGDTNPLEEGAAAKSAEQGDAKPPEEGAAAKPAEQGVAKPPEEDAWYAFHDILKNLLPGPTEDGRDDLKEDEIANKIRDHLGLEGRRSLIVIDDHDFYLVDVWPWMKKVLSTFGCARGSAVVVTTRVDFKQAREFCRERITYSLVNFFYEKVNKLIDRNYQLEPNDFLKKNLRSILGEIQDKCEPQVFCMKMFAHYLFANPNRTKEDLDKLRRVLVPPKNALGDTDDAETEIRGTNGKKLLKFCFNDLPRTYQICLLYLAIFPPGEKIRRSRLVGRWIVEGLITGRDMAHAVRTAECCFDTLVNRWFVCPVDIGTTRKVKSCTVKHELVQELITEIAREEQFLDPRLSRELAKHFSVHSDLRLRRSDTITEFMLSLRKSSRSSISHTSSQLKLLKVLDLEACPNLKNQHVKNVCNKILLLKCLSIRNTSVDRLPKEINNLMQLEILDIRETRVPSSATKDILIPKLRCLLAGRKGQIPSTDTTRAEEPFSSAEIPAQIKYMTNLEVLSHVEASSASADKLKEISQLWQLRKLGVDIYDNEDHLKNLLEAIRDLNECLRFLSIRIKSLEASSGGTTGPSNTKVPDDVLQDPSKLVLLESLSIRGSTSGQLLPFFFKDGHRLIAKVTLHSTTMKRNDLETYLAKLPNLRCLRLLHKSYTESKLTFEENEFKNLRFLVVECSEITSISFNYGAAPKLEKIVWSFTIMESLSGIDNLGCLRDLGLNGASVPDKVRESIEAQLQRLLTDSPSLMLQRFPPSRWKIKDRC